MPEHASWDIDDINAVVDRINAGAQVPTVEPSLIEYIWRSLEDAARVAREQRQSAPAGLRPGILLPRDRIPKSPDQRAAMMMRCALLKALVERRVLDDYMKDESLRQKVFAAAALFPCDKNDFDEAGYDPKHPRVGGRFIEWMRHNC